MAWTEPHPTRLPSPQEIVEVRSIIRDVDLKIAAISDQIEALSRLRSRFQTIRDNQASFIATFRRLPPEILEEIALYYIDEQDFFGVGVLDQVCSSLRAVVLRMKWIWQKIFIVHKKIVHSYPSDIVCTGQGSLQLALMRAAPLPVTLVVEAQLNNYSFASLGSLTSHIETLVLDNFHLYDRVYGDLGYPPIFPKMELPGLKRIDIVGDYLPPKYIFECFDAICNSKLPNIYLYMTQGELIDVAVLARHPISQRIHTLDIANCLITGEFPLYDESMPQLETLILGNSIGFLQCPMPKLRSLSIHAPEAIFPLTLIPKTVEILDILNLKALKVHEVVNASPSFTLTNLTHFSLKNTSLIDNHWPRLDLPNLQKLIVWNVTVTGAHQMSDRLILGDKGVFGFLPALILLSLRCLRQPLTEDFSTTPSLRVLKIAECLLAKDILPCLVEYGTVLPDLQELCIDLTACQSIDRFEWRCKSVRPDLEVKVIE